VLGLETELAVRVSDDRHARRVHRLVAAVAENMAPHGVLVGGGGGDGGLFSGITARYLALVNTELPGDTEADDLARNTACDIVLASAEAAWENRQSVDGLPLFSAFWDRPAELPPVGSRGGARADGAVQASHAPERDLSVQVSGWMLMEAAHAVC
jgi:predicted alpha-1,6-mannanase (GH76 family)